MEFPEIDIKNLPQMPDARERFLSSAIGKMRDAYCEIRNGLQSAVSQRDEYFQERNDALRRCADLAVELQTAKLELDESRRRLESLAARLCPPLPAREPLTRFAPMADGDPFDGGVMESNIPKGEI